MTWDYRQMTPPTRRTLKGLVADLRDAITAGEWAPGDPLPTTSDLRLRYGGSTPLVSRAIQQLKAEGLVTGVSGGRTRVRVHPVHVRRHNERYHQEKATAQLSEAERAATGVAELDTGMSVNDVHKDLPTYDVVHPPADVAVELALDAGAYVVRRKYVRQHAEGAGVSTATSYLPYELVSPNPKLLDANNEPWAGGTIHQLSTVGIEIDQITDYVTATMATTDEQAEQDIPPG